MQKLNNKQEHSTFSLKNPMNLEKRISVFAELGNRLKNLAGDQKEQLIIRAKNDNSWFTKTNIENAITGICLFLEEDALFNWLDSYKLPKEAKVVGTVMAGNIPLVGFHDLLCVLISGHHLMVKMSSQDNVLMRYIIDEIGEIEPEFKIRIAIVDQLKGMDAIIATGSDNTARYFEYYFGKYPNIIRKNRTSCAILNGKESESDFQKLGIDIFSYYGLGCRNVSKLYVPTGYDFRQFFEGIEQYKNIHDHHKYANNYGYNKSIYLINGEKHLDNGFLLVKPSTQVVSPISVLFYEEYSNNSDLIQKLKTIEDKTQCLVSTSGWYNNSFNFGDAQKPKVSDYADHVDTLKFLCKI